MRERQIAYKVRVIPVVTGCLRGGMSLLKEDLRELFERKEELRRTEQDNIVGNRASC